ncbi:MAG: DNA repair exonuclease, partial [Desulfobacteraceae bacterium]
MKFIHAADIHLDSPITGLESYEGAPVEEAREASRKAFINLVDLAVSEKVDFVLIAGDLFDGDWKDYNTGLFLAAQTARLKDEGVPAFIVSGNHDAASRITKHLRMPDNVKFFSSSAPETVMLEGLGIALHGQGYSSRAVSDDLSADYPQALPNYFNIGLLHTSLDGRPGHERYAPSTPAGLLSKGYDYWALGHVHASEVVRKAPWIVFPGNIQGRNIRETGPKGCTLVKVDDDGVVDAGHRDLDVFRWAFLNVDGSEAKDFDDLCDLISRKLAAAWRDNSRMPLAVRLEVVGAPGKDVPEDPERLRNELRSLAYQAGEGGIWLEKIHFSGDEPAVFTSSGGQAVSVLLETIE